MWNLFYCYFSKINLNHRRNVELDFAIPRYSVDIYYDIQITYLDLLKTVNPGDGGGGE